VYALEGMREGREVKRIKPLCSRVKGEMNSWVKREGLYKKYIALMKNRVHGGLYILTFVLISVVKIIF